MTHRASACPLSDTSLSSNQPGQAHDRHQAAVARTLGWADDAAERRDFRDALAWLRTLEAIGETLPAPYQRKREAWTRAVGATDKAA